jgi:hypothetical protein
MTTNCRFTIPRNILAVLNGFQSRDETRHTLMGTHFECRRDSVTLVATCGRRVASYYYEKAVLMPAEHKLVTFTADSTNALKLLRDVKKPWTVDLNEDGSKVSFSINADLAVCVPNLEKTGKQLRFPNWRCVIPTSPILPVSEFLFNPELMAPFVVAAKLLAYQNSSMKIVTHEGVGVNSSPFSIWIGAESFYGVLMPLRDFAENRGIPAWCLRPNETPAEPTGETTQPAPAPVAEAKVYPPIC